MVWARSGPSHRPPTNKLKDFSVEATKERDKLVAVLHAQQALQHCIPGVEVVCAHAINGDDGGLWVKVCDGLQHVLDPYPHHSKAICPTGPLVPFLILVVLTSPKPLCEKGNDAMAWETLLLEISKVIWFSFVSPFTRVMPRRRWRTVEVPEGWFEMLPSEQWPEVDRTVRAVPRQQDPRGRSSRSQGVRQRKEFPRCHCGRPQSCWQVGVRHFSFGRERPHRACIEGSSPSSEVTN